MNSGRFVSKHSGSRETQLKKYFRYTDEKLVPSIHKFRLLVKISSIHWHCRSEQDTLSFWLEVVSNSEKIKSNYYSFKELTTKPIYISFFNEPKAIIDIQIKYFRKLEQYTFGTYSLVIPSGHEGRASEGNLQRNSTITVENDHPQPNNSVSESVVIENRDNGDFMTCKIIGKKVFPKSTKFSDYPREKIRRIR